MQWIQAKHPIDFEFITIFNDGMDFPGKFQDSTVDSKNSHKRYHTHKKNLLGAGLRVQIAYDSWGFGFSHS